MDYKTEAERHEDTRRALARIYQESGAGDYRAFLRSMEKGDNRQNAIAFQLFAASEYSFARRWLGLE